MTNFYPKVIKDWGWDGEEEGDRVSFGYSSAFSNLVFVDRE